LPCIHMQSYACENPWEGLKWKHLLPFWGEVRW